MRVCIYVYSHHVRHVAGGGELLCFSTRTLSSSLFLSPGDLSRLPCARARFFLFSVSCLSALPPSSPSILFRSTHAFSSQRSMRRIEGERDFFFRRVGAPRAAYLFMLQRAATRREMAVTNIYSVGVVKLRKLNVQIFLLAFHLS